MQQFLVLLFFISSAGLFGQSTEKIKIKKQDQHITEFKNDSCDFKVLISNEVYQKNFVVNSYDMEDGHEKEIAFSSSFQKVLRFLEQNIDVTPLTIQTIFMDVCRIGSYKLKAVEVIKHPTKKPQYQNRIDIFLTYSKQ